MYLFCTNLFVIQSLGRNWCRLQSQLIKVIPSLSTEVEPPNKLGISDQTFSAEIDSFKNLYQEWIFLNEKLAVLCWRNRNFKTGYKIKEEAGSKIMSLEREIHYFRCENVNLQYRIYFIEEIELLPMESSQVTP